MAIYSYKTEPLVDFSKKAAKVQKGQIWLKRVIAEMFGKDTIVVDNGIDVDFTAEAIVKLSLILVVKNIVLAQEQLFIVYSH